MLKFDFNPFPNLESKRLKFRQLSHHDASEILFLRSDERIMKFMDAPRLQTQAEAIIYIDKSNKSVQENNGITWGIVPKGETKVIGYIGFWNTQLAHYRTEIGYVLHPDYWRKGLMSEALQTVINYAFAKTKLHSIEANTNQYNSASASLLKKHGFVQEAHFKENYYYDGKFLDSVIFSLLRYNWE